MECIYLDSGHMRLQLCIVQVPNNQNTLIVQSIFQNTLRRFRRCTSIIAVKILNSLGQAHLLIHMIQCKIWIKPKCFIKQVRPASLRQYVIQLTWMTWPSFNPDLHTYVPIAKILILLYLIYTVCKIDINQY